MRALLMTCCWLTLATSLPAQAADYTLTTTPPQDAALTFATQKHNTEQPATEPPTPPLTPQQMLQTVIDQTLANFAVQRKEALQSEASTLKEKYDAAPPATQKQIDDLLH